MKRVPIFKPGRHTAASGTTLDFSEEQVAASIAAYDPKVHEAPLVIGHPKDNGPAWGWVSGLSFAEGEVVADVSQVAPEFAEMVSAGRFKKRSASFYTPDSPSNPVPGVYYLRHVGFLGAQPPAVKGLSAVQFSDTEEGVVEFSDDAMNLSTVAYLFRRLRDLLLVKFGQEDADITLPAYSIEDLERAAADARTARANEMGFEEPAAPAASTPTSTEESAVTLTPAEIAALQERAARADALESQAANFSEREAQLAARERTAAVAAIRADLDQHVKAGRLLPAQVAPLAEFMAGLSDEGEAVEFGEPVEGKTPKVSQRAYLSAFLASLPKAVDFSERAPGTGAQDASGLTGQQIADKANAHIKHVRETEGREVSYVEAVNHVCTAEGGE